MALEYLSGWPLSSWISPGAAFFLFVNVLICAIVVTSRGHHQGGRAAAASTRRLCRSASSMVFDRLGSFSLFSVDPVPLELEEYYPATSLETAVPEPSNTHVAAVAAVADGASSEIARDHEVEAGEDNSVISSDEAQGLALQGPLAEQQSPSAEAAVNAAEAGETTAAAEGKEEAEQEATTMQRAPPSAASSSRRETEEALEGKAALNARAESFIRKFREDLKLERLNSIINYTRALRRGAGGAASPTGQ